MSMHFDSSASQPVAPPGSVSVDWQSLLLYKPHGVPADHLYEMPNALSLEVLRARRI
ncbi:hypothetical protein P280DRAFT_505968 [Massarina eburnea CBS 473.64]|uniref:Uncharacterized protein n=1 Tax=Massarina eburnea CBS 473.64 TaxID=1395130 RepID=A0A6A6S6D2_9PLEO|nr:hypothetical protein P280DRAFT_505968 [Massarina eburnea CBS 473.64]